MKSILEHLELPLGRVNATDLKVGWLFHCYDDEEIFKVMILLPSVIVVKRQRDAACYTITMHSAIILIGTENTPQEEIVYARAWASARFLI